MHGASGGTKSIPKVFGNIFISFIGAGVLGLPYAFKEAGILEGIFIMSLVGYLSVCAMLLLIDCKDYMVANRNRMTRSRSADHWAKADSAQTTSLLSNGSILVDSNDEQESKYANGNENSKDKSDYEIGYGDVGYYAYGKSGSTLVDIAIVVSQTGFCCAYLIFIIENTAQYFTHAPKGETDSSTTPSDAHIQRWILVTMLLPLCVLCFLRHLHKLAVFSIFADFANVFAYSIVFWFDFEESHRVKSVHPKEIDLSGFPFFAGMAVYCYEGAGMILSLEGSMASEVRSKFRRIFKWAMLLITTLYIVFGVCGYLSFGENTNSIITLNLPAGLFPLLVKLCLCCSLFFTYPVMMFPVVQIIEKRSKNLFSSYLAGNILRVFMVIVTGLIVIVIPSFSTLMSLVGATFCSMLAFIMPALFHMKIFKSEMTNGKRILDYLLIFVGICAIIIGTADALKRLGIIPSDEVQDIFNATFTSAAGSALQNPDVPPSPSPGQ